MNYTDFGYDKILNKPTGQNFSPLDVRELFPLKGIPKEKLDIPHIDSGWANVVGNGTRIISGQTVDFNVIYKDAPAVIITFTGINASDTVQGGTQSGYVSVEVYSKTTTGFTWGLTMDSDKTFDNTKYYSIDWVAVGNVI